MDRRLQKRYWLLVGGHMKSANPQAAAIAKLPAAPSSFSVTQAAWRFFNNERVSLHDMMVPIREAGCQAAAESESNYVLAVHDWSKIACGRHHSKNDLLRLTHDHDIGYELYSCLMVDCDNGNPLAPMELRLETGTEIHHTQDPELVVESWHTDQVTGVMHSAKTWGVDQKIVHVIDQEADSVAHYRQWSAADELFLVRSEDRTAMWRGESRKFSSIVRTLLREDAFETEKMIPFRGREHELRVAQTEVVLDRPARTRVNGKQIKVPGVALPLRLVVSRVYDENNRKQAEWFLLTNTPVDVGGTQIANWYYWRWRIETFFKLLKSSGFELEHWLQTTGKAFAKRLLVAAMACVVIWQLERDPSDDSVEMKTLLVKLSGRQMKRSRPFTAPAMLAGLEKLLPMMEILQTHTIKQIRALARKTLPVQLLNSS
jgi:hypothetical protein